jgi:DNA (cytosine-5)-methyltransferase 1
MQDPRSNLFLEYIRLLNGLKPRVFVAENVSGLVKGVAKGTFKEILQKMRVCGYKVECRLLDAQWLGVPQCRKRVIFVGVRNDVKGVPIFPLPLSYNYSVAEACPWITGTMPRRGHGYFPGDEIDLERSPLPTVTKSTANTGTVLYTNGGFIQNKNVPNMPCAAITASQCRIDVVQSEGRVSDGKRLNDRSAPTIRRGRAGTLSVVEHIGPTIDGMAIGEAAKSLGTGEQSKRFFNLVNIDVNMPSLSRLKSHGGKSVASPVVENRRKFSILELKRICAFPDNFNLEPAGSYAKRWAVLGNSVPPLMMKAIAEKILELLL